MRKSLSIGALTLGAVGLAMPAFAQCSSSDEHASSQANVMQASWTSGPDIVDTAAKAGSFKTLIAAVQAAGLEDALRGGKGLTVFAPTDDAFAKLPKGTVETLLKPENRDLLRTILLYHVVGSEVGSDKVVKLNNAATLSGQRIDFKVTKQGVRVDNANVIKTDVEASNGVIHVIDTVIMPATNDIIDTAVEAGSFSTLAAALDAAKLVHTLKGEGPFTVFAPTDEAFASLPAGTVETLLKPANKKKLTSILTYHVVPGRIYADQAVSAGMATTVEGGSVRFGFDGGQLQVNGANVIATDIETSNGVIHVIDQVILPE